MAKEAIKWEIHHGRQPYQRMKAYLVMKILQGKTDEEHPLSANAIVAELNTRYGINAEKKSIYKDIEEINIYYNLIQGESENPYEVQKGLKDGTFEKVIHYDEHKKGFYFKDLDRDYEDYRLIAEAIYCAKFLDQKQADRLVNLACENVSHYADNQIKHRVSNLDSKKTDNKDTFYNITKISDAMSLDLDGDPHEPCKISFRYLKHEINLFRETVEKRNGKVYTVSPYDLIINEGNYYLRAFEDESQKMKTYRLDRMRQVKVLEGQPRCGEKVATADKHNYSNGMFGMFSGDKQIVKIQFVMSLLDAVNEKIGKNAKYQMVDEHHFTVEAEIEVSPQFFAWICGLGTNVEILEPAEIKYQYIDYLNKILKKYK